MKNILKIALCIICSATYAQDKESPLDFNAGIQTNHLWRGLIITDKPMVSTNLSLTLDAQKKFKVGIWAGTSISNDSDDTHYKEIDYYVQYTTGKGLTIGIWDLFNSRNISPEIASNDILNYAKDRTAHIIDLRTSYQFPESFPLTAEVNVMLYGGAHAGEVLRINDTYDRNKYSTYTQLSYPLYQKDENIRLDAFVGAGFAFNGNHSLYGNTKNNFDLVNVGCKASKNIEVFGHRLPVFLTTMWNPSNKYARVQVATNLF